MGLKLKLNQMDRRLFPLKTLSTCLLSISVAEKKLFKQTWLRTYTVFNTEANNLQANKKTPTNRVHFENTVPWRLRQISKPSKPNILILKLSNFSWKRIFFFLSGCPEGAGKCPPVVRAGCTLALCLEKNCLGSWDNCLYLPVLYLFRIFSLSSAQPWRVIQIQTSHKAFILSNSMQRGIFRYHTYTFFKWLNVSSDHR